MIRLFFRTDGKEETIATKPKQRMMDAFPSELSLNCPPLLTVYIYKEHLKTYSFLPGSKEKKK